MKDNSGQLIVISGFIIALGVITLTIMLNSVIYAGNSAYEGTMDTPRNNIQHLDQLTCREANNAYYNASTVMGVFDPSYFNPVKYQSYMDSYSQNVSLNYALKGASVQETNNPFDQSNKIAKAIIVYNDTGTVYKHSADINIAPISLSDSVTAAVSGNPTALKFIVGGSFRDINGTVNVSKTTTPSITFNVALIDKSGAVIGKSVPIYVSATNGTLSQSQPNTDSNGLVSCTISSNNLACVSTITAYSPGLTAATLHLKFY